jgi:hypothetical protein
MNARKEAKKLADESKSKGIVRNIGNEFPDNVISEGKLMKKIANKSMWIDCRRSRNSEMDSLFRISSLFRIFSIRACHAIFRVSDFFRHHEEVCEM